MASPAFDKRAGRATDKQPALPAALTPAEAVKPGHKRRHPFAAAMHQLYGPFPDPDVIQWPPSVRGWIVIGGGVACWFPLLAWLMGWIG